MPPSPLSMYCRGKGMKGPVQRITGSIQISEGIVKYTKLLTVACVRDCIWDMTKFATRDVVYRISAFIYKKNIKPQGSILIRREWFADYYEEDPYYGETERFPCISMEVV